MSDRTPSRAAPDAREPLGAYAPAAAPHDAAPHDAAYTPDEKLRCEIEKLRAETLALRRPFYQTPGPWLAGVTALAGIIGVGIQYQKSERAYELAAIKREQAQLDIAVLERKRAQADSARARADSARLQADSQLTLVSQQLQSTQALRGREEERLRVVMAQLSRIQSAPGAQATVAAAVQRSLDTLQSAIQASQAAAAQSRRSVRTIDRLRTEIAAPAKQAARTTVYLQFSGGGDEARDRALMQRLQATLGAAGYAAPGVERVREREGSSVRYFHDADRASAEAVADLVARTVPLAGRPQVIRPGYTEGRGIIEVWIDLTRTR